MPFHEQWEKDGIVDREVWAKAGAQGLLALQLPEEYGGGGTPDFRYNLVVNEEMTRRGVYGCAFPLFNDMIVPYLVVERERGAAGAVVPRLCAGDDDRRDRDDRARRRLRPAGHPDHAPSTRATTTCSTARRPSSPTASSPTSSSSWRGPIPTPGHQGISLLVVERGMAGFERGRNLDKIGQHAQDTAELFFDDVRVPKANLLGEEGSGFVHLMTNLAAGAALHRRRRPPRRARRSSRRPCAYVKERTAFGRPIGTFQHNRFVLAEMATEAHIARVFLDDCVARHVRGELDAKTASMAKWWTDRAAEEGRRPGASSSTAATATWRSTPSPGPT